MGTGPAHQARDGVAAGALMGERMGDCRLDGSLGVSD